MVLLLAFQLQGVPEIKNLAEIQRLEKSVKKVVVKAMPATVALISPEGGAGSGVIISKEGLILTAAHVTDGSRQMTVVFPDGREEKAKVLGANYSRDAAMAQLIGGGPWPYVDVKESDSMKVGDFVVAMGHPKGFDPTRPPPVRFGRVITRKENDFITTDCTIIGGDSGGPLFDLSGRVVGIHSHISPDQKMVNNHAGISGFQRSWDKMLAGKSWGALGASRDNERRPVLGVYLSVEDDKLRIDRMNPESPAARSGLLQGDIIKKLGGRAVEDAAHMRELLIDYEPGDRIEVMVEREGEFIGKEIQLASVVEVFRRYRR